MCVRYDFFVSYDEIPRRACLLTFGNGNGLDEDDGGGGVDNDISVVSHVDSLGENGREHHGGGGEMCLCVVICSCFPK